MDEPQHYLKTELKERLANDPEMFDFLLGSSLDGVWYWDMENPENEWMSPEFWHTLGIDPATREHLASEWQAHIHADDLQDAFDKVEEHVRSPGSTFEHLVRYKHSDSSTAYIRCRAMVFRDEDGTPVRMLGTHADVTKLKRIENALLASNVELRTQLDRANLAVQAKQSFLSMMSHEIRTPLNAILGMFELIAETSGEEKQVRRARNGFAAAETLLELLNNVLTSAQSGSSEMVIVPRDMVFADLVHHAEVLLEGAIIKSGAKLTYSVVVSGTAPVVVHLDGGALQQILSNLIHNAVKFTETGSVVVTLGCHETQTGHMVECQVTDTGIGIAPEDHRLIFEEFRQADTGIARRHGGSGLGLSISRTLAERMGGSLTVTSTPGEGATFLCRIPSLQAQGTQHDA